jgi:hypothetical protein
VPSSKVVGDYKITEVRAQLIIAVIVVALHHGVFDGPVYSLHLAMCARVVEFSQSMLNVMRTANLV